MNPKLILVLKYEDNIPLVKYLFVKYAYKFVFIWQIIIILYNLNIKTMFDQFRVIYESINPFYNIKNAKIKASVYWIHLTNKWLLNLIIESANSHYINNREGLKFWEMKWVNESIFRCFKIERHNFGFKDSYLTQFNLY